MFREDKSRSRDKGLTGYKNGQRCNNSPPHYANTRFITPSIFLM